MLNAERAAPELHLTMPSNLVAILLVASASAWQLPKLDRRSLFTAAAAAATNPNAANAFVAGTDNEVSGLVVLRIAEVCEFQEKLMRTIAKCQQPNAKTLVDQFGLPYCGEEASYTVSPGQIMFATGIMLKNSNLDGNLKLMIREEVPARERENAINDAVIIMNTFNSLIARCQGLQVFEQNDLVEVADIYGDARRKLAKFFDYLPTGSKDKFYGFAADVRKYEEKESSEGGIERMKL